MLLTVGYIQRDESRTGGGIMTVGQRIRKLRLARGLSQKDLAAPRYTAAHVSTIETGRRQPSRKALEYFAERLDIDVDELATGLPRSLVPQLELNLQEARVALSSGDASAAKSQLTHVRRSAAKYGLRRLIAKADELSGTLAERRGDTELALSLFESAESLFAEELITLAVDSIAGKARCLKAAGKIRYAIHVLEDFLLRIERLRLRDPDAIARAHASLIILYLEAGLFEKAAASAAEALSLANRVSDPFRAAWMHMYVARYMLQEGRVDDAQRALAKAEDLFRQLELRSEMAAAHLAKGLVLSRALHIDDARHELELAADIFTETGDARHRARALNELARIERLENDHETARMLLTESIAAIGTADASILAWAHRELGILLGDHDPQAAEEHFRTAITLYEKSGAAVELALTYGELGDMLRAQGSTESGSDMYRAGIRALEPVVQPSL